MYDMIVWPVMTRVSFGSGWDHNIFPILIPNSCQDEMGISHNSQSTDHLPYKAGTIPNSVGGSKDNAHSPSPTFLTRSSIFHIRQVVCAFEKCGKCGMRAEILTYSQFPLRETDLVPFPNPRWVGMGSGAGIAGWE